VVEVAVEEAVVVEEEEEEDTEAEAGLLADTILAVTADLARHRPERDETAGPGLLRAPLRALPPPLRPPADPPAPSAMPAAAPQGKRTEMTRAPLLTIKRPSVLFKLPRATHQQHTRVL